MRENLEEDSPAGGKLLPDNLTTQTNVVRHPLNSQQFTFPVGANQPKAIRDYAASISPAVFHNFRIEITKVDLTPKPESSRFFLNMG